MVASHPILPHSLWRGGGVLNYGVPYYPRVPPFTLHFITTGYLLRVACVDRQVGGPSSAGCPSGTLAVSPQTVATTHGPGDGQVRPIAKVAIRHVPTWWRPTSYCEVAAPCASTR